MISDSASGDLLIIPNFVTKAAQSACLRAIDKNMRRLAGRSYWKAHFDGVINEYREFTYSDWLKDLQDISEDEKVITGVIRRMQQVVMANPSSKGNSDRNIKWLAPHILDLDAHGDIRPHVDNVKASGSIVMAICLGSPAIIQFRKIDQPSEVIVALLEPGTFYMQRDNLRFDYTHEIPKVVAGNGLFFKDTRVARGRRVTLLLRDALLP